MPKDGRDDDRDVGVDDSRSRSNESIVAKASRSAEWRRPLGGRASAEMVAFPIRGRTKRTPVSQPALAEEHRSNARKMVRGVTAEDSRTEIGSFVSRID
mmetsp:Transcript_34113/g.71260  ORF Transcript_34113/g.71260 Transcript_34113/m.71260 type:complete len:99 (+) Transcript_34113:468-764(+)